MSIKILIPDLLHFDKGNMFNGEQKGRGYYFKGKFVSKYKSLLIDAMREKFKDDFSDENKEIFADEWKVIHYFSDISTKATAKTYEKKKEYYAELKKATELGNIQREITKLQYKIDKMEREKVHFEALKKTYQDSMDNLKKTFIEKSKVKK